MICPNCSLQIINDKCNNCSLLCPFCNSIASQRNADKYQLYFICKNHPNQLLFFLISSHPWKLQINVNNFHLIIYDSSYISKCQASSHIYYSPCEPILSLPINIQNCHSFVNHPNLFNKLQNLLIFQ